MLPSLHFEADKFFEQAMQLRARFEVNTPDSLFLPDAEQTNIPIDAIPIFI
jgi:hypothetical protein